MTAIQELMQRYMQLYPIEGVDELVLNKIESSLKLRLPEDFRQIASFYSGGLLGGISIFAFDNLNPNILDETLRLRNTINLPSRFIILAEPPASLIVMDTENTPSVIWCDATDVEGLNKMSFASNMEHFLGIFYRTN